MPKKRKNKILSKGGRVKKLFSLRGGAGLFLLVLVALAMGIFFVMGPKQDNEPLEEKAEYSCLDYDPPDQTDSVVLSGDNYDLIKKNAGIVESKMNEMEKIGTYNSRDIYKLKSTNYFGESKNDYVIYALREKKEGYYYFDIYFKRGIPIPDSIKNGKSIGGEGTVTIVIDDDLTFPPRGFNSSKIVEPLFSLNYPTYIYSENKTNVNAILSLGAKQAGTLSTSKGNLRLYFHLDSLYLIHGQDAYEYIPSNEDIDFEKFLREAQESLQIKKLTIKTVKVNPICWFTPSCKPALYLYPKRKTDVKVKVIPRGYFTYTNPEYDEKRGWEVTANPDGTIDYNSEKYPYLYYETKIDNSELTIPDKGYVVKYGQLDSLFDELLYTLGLSKKEVNDFKDYWLNVLPESKYYFVGLVDISTINHIERLSISPSPDQIIRVRLYFEPLNEYKKVESPEIKKIDRDNNGFLAIEWGGLIKVSDDMEFTCSQ